MSSPGLFPIKRPFGVEITRMHPKLRISGRSDDELDYDDQQYLEDSVVAMGSKIDKRFIAKVYCDPGCAEFPTQILSSYESLAKAWTHVDKLGKKYGLVINGEHAWGGGGHVNVGFTKFKQPALSLKDRQVMYFNLVRMLVENPFLVWAYGDPGDNHGSTNFGIETNPQRVIDEEGCSFFGTNYSSIDSARRVVQGSLSEFRYERAQTFLEFEHVNNLLKEWQDPAIVAKDSHEYLPKEVHGKWRPPADYVEMRFFGTATTEAEQVSHVELAQALMEHAVTFTPQYGFPKKRFADLKRDLDGTVASFQGFIQKHKLDWERHKVFVKNLETRFSYGKAYLT